jgi:tetratricopeptide (TPR) repeat protein
MAVTAQAKHRITAKLLLLLSMTFFACKDTGCKDIMKGSSLRRYDVSDRIEKINKEISLLEKNDKDQQSVIRLGDLHEQLATIYIEKEDLDTALIHVDKAFTYRRNNPYLNYLAGLIYGNKGAKSGLKDEINKSEGYYRRAITLKHNYDEALYGLAILLFLYKNERPEPILILEELYKRTPSYYQARFALGRFYYESGRKEEALDIYSILRTDLNKLPDSQIIRTYIESCNANIQKIQNEIHTSQ